MFTSRMDTSCGVSCFGVLPAAGAHTVAALTHQLAGWLTAAAAGLLCVQGHEGYEDNMIDDAIEDEFNENEQSFNPVSLRCCSGGGLQGACMTHVACSMECA